MIEGPFNMGMLKDFIRQDDKVLDIMTGKGDALISLHPFAKTIVAVDIYEPYLLQLKKTYPDVLAIHNDSLAYLKGLPDSCFDLVTCIDGIEHIDKAAGYELIKEMKRVTKRTLVIFTPDGYSENHPHNAWGIEGGDIHQKHLSGWTLEDLQTEGFVLQNRTQWQNAYTGETYYSLLVSYEKV